MKDNTDLRKIHAALLCCCSSSLLLANLLNSDNMMWLRVIFIVLGVIASVALIVVGTVRPNSSQTLLL